MRIYVQKLYFLYLHDEERYRPEPRLSSLLLTWPVVPDAALPHSFGRSDDIAPVVYRTVHLTQKVAISACSRIASLFLTLSSSSASNSDPNGYRNHIHCRSTCRDIGRRVFQRRGTIVELNSRFKGWNFEPLYLDNRDTWDAHFCTKNWQKYDRGCVKISAPHLL